MTITPTFEVPQRLGQSATENLLGVLSTLYRQRDAENAPEIDGLAGQAWDDFHCVRTRSRDAHVCERAKHPAPWRRVTRSYGAAFGAFVESAKGGGMRLVRSECQTLRRGLTAAAESLREARADAEQRATDTHTRLDRAETHARELKAETVCLQRDLDEARRHLRESGAELRAVVDRTVAATKEQSDALEAPRAALEDDVAQAHAAVVEVRGWMRRLETERIAPMEDLAKLWGRLPPDTELTPWVCIQAEGQEFVARRAELYDPQEVTLWAGIFSGRVGWHRAPLEPTAKPGPAGDAAYVFQVEASAMQAILAMRQGRATFATQKIDAMWSAPLHRLLEHCERFGLPRVRDVAGACRDRDVLPLARAVLQRRQADAVRLLAVLEAHGARDIKRGEGVLVVGRAWWQAWLQHLAGGSFPGNVVLGCGTDWADDVFLPRRAGELLPLVVSPRVETAYPPQGVPWLWEPAAALKAVLQATPSEETLWHVAARDDVERIMSFEATEHGSRSGSA